MCNDSQTEDYDGDAVGFFLSVSNAHTFVVTRRNHEFHFPHEKPFYLFWPRVRILHVVSHCKRV